MCKRKESGKLLAIPAALTLFLLPSVTSTELVQGTVIGKSFFFAYALCAVGVACMAGWLYRPKQPVFIRPTDAAVTVGIVYVLANICLTHVPVSLRCFEWTGLCLLYICLRQLEPVAFRPVWIAVVLGATVQALHGNLQLWGMLPSTSGFPMSGSFFNPGPYAGYLATALPLAVGGWLYGEGRFFRRIMAGACLLICLALAGSHSRAAWLATIVGTGFLVAGRFGWKHWLESQRLSVRLALGGLTIVCIVCAATGLYRMKAGSADGRWLIWKVTAGLVEEHPLVGIGFDGFRTRYMEQQAGYFRTHPDSAEGMLAGDTAYCFNEALQAVAETGFIGLLVGMGILWTAFSGKHRAYQAESRMCRAGLTAIAVFALFSYPSQVLPIKAIGVCYLAGLTAIDTRGIRLAAGHKAWMPKVVSAMGMTALLIVGMMKLVPYRKAWQEWSRSYADYRAGNYVEAARRCAQAYPWLHSHGDFLTYYGKTLAQSGDAAQAVDVLRRAKECYPNTIVYTTLGDCYKSLGQTAEAEQAYLQAGYMIPHRFYPIYLLAKLYDETGQQAKAIAAAEELLGKEVKVESTAVEQMREEMQKLIKQNKTRE